MQEMRIFPQQEEFFNKLSAIVKVFQDSDGAIRPHAHITGPSGSGKSYLIKKLADSRKIPFLEINAAGLTAEGLSGNSISKALGKLREHWDKPNIVFVDEFDKLFLRNGETTEGFRTAVQDEFLTMLESKYASVFGEYGKYDQVVVENSLFFFAGAYSDQEIRTMAQLRDAGIRREFIGRVPLVLYTDAIPLHELVKYIPNTALFKNYSEMFPQKIKGASQKISQIIKEQGNEFSIGIRMLNSATHQYFLSGIAAEPFSAPLVKKTKALFKLK